MHVVLLGAPEVLQGHGLRDLADPVEQLVEEDVEVALEELVVSQENSEVGARAPEQPLRAGEVAAPRLEPGEVVLRRAEREQHRPREGAGRQEEFFDDVGRVIDARYRRRNASEPDADFSVCSQWWNPPVAPAVTSWL